MKCINYVHLFRSTQPSMPFVRFRMGQVTCSASFDVFSSYLHTVPSSFMRTIILCRYCTYLCLHTYFPFWRFQFRFSLCQHECTEFSFSCAFKTSFVATKSCALNRLLLYTRSQILCMHIRGVSYFIGMSAFPLSFAPWEFFGFFSINFDIFTGQSFDLLIVSRRLLSFDWLWECF